jgi:EVE domain
MSKSAIATGRILWPAPRMVTGRLIGRSLRRWHPICVRWRRDAWSWENQVAKGAKGEAWTGVRNHTAKQNLMKMKKGDRAFFYHSGEGKEIVGIAEVIRESFPDPTASPGDPWVAVD